MQQGPYYNDAEDIDGPLDDQLWSDHYNYDDSSLVHQHYQNYF